MQLSFSSGLSYLSNHYSIVFILIQCRLYSGQIPEVLGKLCGCKNLKEFSINFNSDNILGND